MSQDDRLSQIETLWSMVYRAHHEADTSDSNHRLDAQHQLLARYGNAIQRYLAGALRDPHAAEDVYQEFAVRFLRGDYRKVSAEKGRFRNFLKVVLARLVADHHRYRLRRPTVSLDVDVIASQANEQRLEQDFHTIWRDQLLAQAWERLKDDQERSGQPWMTVLRLRVENPQWRSQQLADQLSELTGSDFTAERLRVVLHRSREKFADHLIQVIAQSLEADTLEAIEAELAELELLPYCQSVLQRRQRQTPPKD